MGLIDSLLEKPEFTKINPRLFSQINQLTKAKAEEDPVLQKKELGKVKRKLDTIFWEMFEIIVLDALKRESFEFSIEEQLFLNFGLLHNKLLEAIDGESSPDLIELYEEKLTKYLRNPKNDSIFYLTEWIQGWEVDAKLYIKSHEDETSEHDWIDDEKAKKYLSVRANIYKKLLPFFKNLPGVNEALLKSILKGDFDKNVELAYAEKKSPDKNLSISNQRIIAIHRTLFVQLKAALRTSPEELKLATLLEKITESFVERRIGMSTISKKPKQEEKSNSDQLEDIMLNEIKLIKNLLPIGGMEGKEFFTSPLITEFKPPLSKSFVKKTMEHIRECDPNLPNELPVVIVPYRGSGFFEWDKNFLIVPVTPSIPAQETITRAVANYRILTDNLEHNGEMKRQYERNLDRGGFKERFLQDYNLWVTSISKGHRRIMTNKKFDFFMHYVGPNPDVLFAGHDLSHLSSFQLRKKTQDLLSETHISQEQYYEIAVCFWRLEDTIKSLRYMELAQTSGVPSPKILLSLGYIHKKLRDKAASTRAFKSCLKYFKNSLYGSYASRELD